MMGNPYSSTDPAMGPLMRDIKNKICTDCELIALLEDDNGMELLVANKIINLGLPVRDVYKKVWLPYINSHQTTPATGDPAAGGGGGAHRVGAGEGHGRSNLRTASEVLHHCGDSYGKTKEGAVSTQLLWLSLPYRLHGIAWNLCIGGQKRQAFDDGLGHQHPVEGVFVVGKGGKRLENHQVFFIERQQLKT